MRKRVLLLMLGACFAIGGALVVWTATRKVYRMPAASMEPTIPAGARLVVDTGAFSSRSPRTGDVVVFHPPFSEEEVSVKRVVAVGPAEVDIAEDGTLLVDREPFERQRVDGSTWEERFDGRPHRIRWEDDGSAVGHPPGPWPVLDGMLFLLGDNRQNSHDSRFWGPIDRSAVVGKVTHVYATEEGSPRAVH